MTFLVCYHGESYHIDIETLDDLQTLADRYGWVNLVIDFKRMVINIR